MTAFSSLSHRDSIIFIFLFIVDWLLEFALVFIVCFDGSAVDFLVHMVFIAVRLGLPIMFLLFMFVCLPLPHYRHYTQKGCSFAPSVGATLVFPSGNAFVAPSLLEPLHNDQISFAFCMSFLEIWGG